MGGFNPRQLQDLVTQARQKYEEMQQKMQATVVEGSAGGGSVTVRMNGTKQLLSTTIDPEVVKSGDVEMLQDLMTAAVNPESQRVDEEIKSTMGGMLGGFQIPGMGF